ncbi:hypothetical protein H9Q09_21030 [Aurantimonas sp. DM33-3]|uniref:3'-5' exonuclease n=1 Tax=Aurantimonas sp. DM33-3 TaxID=2766955 RepID=UPI00165279B6|nr:hypothetical protein [Aurantimonas sp. DM33-3]MBC6718671.1 hypothetical protein [Aurantimonas sp. DM33-3]
MENGKTPMAAGDLIELDQIVFLDIEASGLGPDSYPTEIGWAFATGASGGFLIRPASDWSADAWDPLAEELHGISHEELMTNGITPWDAALRINAVLAPDGAPLTVVSDAAEMDSFWLDRLFEEGPSSREFQVRDIEWLRGILPGKHADDANPIDDQRAHRAEADALLLARNWR